VALRKHQSLLAMNNFNSPAKTGLFLLRAVPGCMILCIQVQTNKTIRTIFAFFVHDKTFMKNMYLTHEYDDKNIVKRMKAP